MPATFDGMYLNWISAANCTASCTGTNFNFNPYSNGGPVSFFWPNATDGGVSLDTKTYAVLPVGSTVGPASTYIRLTATAATANFRAGVTNGILGFHMACPAGTCYGYAKVTTTAPDAFPMTVNRWWYDNSGAAITVVP